MRQGYNVRTKANLWELPIFINLAKMLKNEIDIRKEFFRSYESILREKKIIENEMPIEKFDQKNLFLHPKKATYYKDEKFQQMKTPDMPYYSKVFLTSLNIKSLIEPLIKYKVAEETEILLICDKCKKFFLLDSVNCPKCRQKAKRFQLYNLQSEMLNMWIYNPGKFLECLCYNSIKEAQIGTIKQITAGGEIVRRSEPELPETEMDISITFNKNSPQLNDENRLVILCTISAGSPAEKKQAKKFSDSLEQPFVFVTTSPNVPQAIEKRALKCFTRTDKVEFPMNLIEFIKSIKFDL